MAISRYIYTPEYCSTDAPEWAEYDETVVAQIIEDCKAVFELNKDITAINLNRNAVTTCYMGFDDEAVVMDIADEGWRFDCIVLYRDGNEMWERYYQKYTDERMEIRL